MTGAVSHAELGGLRARHGLSKKVTGARNRIGSLCVSIRGRGWALIRAATSFDAFYAAAAPRMARQLYLATGDVTRAQDCCQEAFIRAWRKWDVLSTGAADPHAWVRTVAWRLAVSDWRRAVARLRALARHGPPADVPSPDTCAVRAALATLPVPQRTVLVLHYFADLRVEDIATVLAIPEGTVKARLARGRRALAPLLQEFEETPWTTKN